MLDLLFKFVFNLITKVSQILLTPLVDSLTSLFPSLTVYFSYITQFLAKCLTYVVFVRDMALIPRGAILLLFDYLVIKYSIYLVKISFNFIIKIYNLLKP